MFGIRPAAPTRADDYVIERAGRPLRNARVAPRGLTPRLLARMATARRPAAVVRWIDPERWIEEQSVLLTDVIAGPRPWMGSLLEASGPQPLPVGTLVRRIDERVPDSTRHQLVWPDGCLRAASIANDPREVAAFLDEPAMTHFARALDGGLAPKRKAAEAVTVWFAETIRLQPRANPGHDRPRHARRPAARGRRRPERRLVCRWL